MRKQKRISRSLNLAAVIAFFCMASLSGFSGQALGQGALSVEYDVDRMGSDYHSFALPEAKYELCYNACLQDRKCKAYTYVKPFEGYPAKCWLKNSKPMPIPNRTCCISGVSRSKSRWAGGWWAYSFGDIYLEQNEQDQLTGTYSEGGKLWGTEGDDGKFYFSFRNNDGSAQGQGVWFVTEPAKNRYGGKKCYGFGCAPEGGYDVARK